MSSLPLDMKPLTELRGIATALGMHVDWGWDRLKLLGKIQASNSKTFAPPVVSDIPSDMRLRTVPPSKNLSQHQLITELKHYTDKGLVLTFPQPDLMQLNYGKKQDQVNIRTSLWAITQVVKAVMG